MQPQYSWDGGNVTSLSIVRTSAPTVVVWGLSTPGTNGIASASRHGTVPTGAVETATTEKTLTAGVQYRVTATRLDGTTGFKDFTPVSTSGQFGNALKFNGTSDYVSIPNPNNLLQPVRFTFETWIKRGRTNFPDVVISSNASTGWGVGFNTNNTIYFSRIGVSNVNSTVTISDTNWHHMAVTFDSVNVKFYLDGVLNVSVAYAVQFNSTGIYALGSRPSTSQYAKEQLDEVRIWSTVRSQAEIAGAMSAELAGNESGLVLYYKLNESGAGANIVVLNSTTATGTQLNGTTVGSSTTPVFVTSTIP
jgi:hypothetical protein